MFFFILALHFMTLYPIFRYVFNMGVFSLSTHCKSSLLQIINALIPIFSAAPMYLSTICQSGDGGLLTMIAISDKLEASTSLFLYLFFREREFFLGRMSVIIASGSFSSFLIITISPHTGFNCLPNILAKPILPSFVLIFIRRL